MSPVWITRSTRASRNTETMRATLRALSWVSLITPMRMAREGSKASLPADAARSPARPTRVFFRTLGCAKNQVDSEVMLGSLALGGYAIAEELADADVAVVNTCSFIQSAREESVQAILELADEKESGAL